MTAAAPRWAEAGEMASPGSDPDANLRGAGRKPWLARRARRLRKLWGRVLVLRARRRLHAALSPAERKALRRLRIGAAPMALSPLHHFDGGGYKFQIYCAMLGVRLEPWSVWGAYDVVINWQDVTRDAMDVRAYAETCAREHDRPDCPAGWVSERIHRRRGQDQPGLQLGGHAGRRAQVLRLERAARRRARLGRRQAVVHPVGL